MNSTDSGNETGNESNDSCINQYNADKIQANQCSEIVPRDGRHFTNENAVTGIEFNISTLPNVPISDTISKIHPLTLTMLSNKDILNHPDIFKHSQRPSLHLNNVVQALKPHPRMSSMVIEFKNNVFRDYDSASHALCTKMRRKVGKYPASSPLMALMKSRKEQTFIQAVSTNNTELVEKLLNEGASPNLADGLGRTPLHVAASRGYTDMVRLLLAHSADPNVKDKVGNTPLHLAAVTSKTEIVNLLLRAGTNVLSLDEFGNNPLDLARLKLRVLQRCRECTGVPLNDIKEDVKKVISMLMLYLQEQRASAEQVEALSAICSQLTLSNSPDQIQGDLKSLLDNLDSLSLKQE